MVLDDVDLVALSAMIEFIVYRFLRGDWPDAGGGPF